MRITLDSEHLLLTLSRMYDHTHAEPRCSQVPLRLISGSESAQGVREEGDSRDGSPAARGSRRHGRPPAHDDQVEHGLTFMTVA
jgi:hypothetical protein